MKKVLFVLPTFCWLCLTLFQCKKFEQVNKSYYQDSIITGNVLPPYNRVTTLKIENYINRLYIDLLGREPLNDEMSVGVNYLKNGGLNQITKESYISSMMNSSEYYDRLYEIYSIKMLGGVDSTEIYSNINVAQYVLDSLLIPNGDSLQAHFFEIEIIRLIELLEAKEEYKNNDISLNEFVRRFMMNNIYDEINMGTENFVLGSFENLFYRSPSANEKSASEDMVDGQSSILFLQNGSSKLDFSTIISTNDEFYHGVIMDLFNAYVSRNPTTEETYGLIGDFKLSGELSVVQLYILTSEEYAGF